MACMAYGDGSIEPRGKGRWRIIWYSGGRRRTKTFQGTITEARRERRRLTSESDQGTAVDHRKVRVSELLDDLLDHYRAKGQDVKTCGYRVQKLRPFFGRMLASRVGTGTVKAFVNTRANDVALTTINREIAALKKAFTLGHRHSPRKVLNVPTIEMAGPESKPREGFFAHEEFLSLRSNLAAEVGQLVTFLYYTGCRVGEARGLRWDRVSLSDNVIRLVETKNKERRVIPLTAELRLLLESLKDSRDVLWPESPWVFSRKGKQIKDFRQAWENACAATKIQGRLVHDLRRTGARNLLRAGVPLHIVMAIGGWKTPSMLKRYDIVDTRDLENAAAALDRYLGGQAVGLESEVVN